MAVSYNNIALMDGGARFIIFSIVTKTTQSMKKLRKTKLMTNNQVDPEKLLTRKIRLVRSLFNT